MSPEGFQINHVAPPARGWESLTPLAYVGAALRPPSEEDSMRRDRRNSGVENPNRQPQPAGQGQGHADKADEQYVPCIKR